MEANTKLKIGEHYKVTREFRAGFLTIPINTIVKLLDVEGDDWLKFMSPTRPNKPFIISDVSIFENNTALLDNYENPVEKAHPGILLSPEVFSKGPAPPFPADRQELLFLG